MRIRILLLFAFLAVASARRVGQGSQRPIFINRPTLPKLNRHARSADPEPQTGGSIYVHGEKPLSGPDRRPSFDVGYQHKIFENKHGSIDVGGGAQKLPGQRWEPNVGISTTFRYKREAEDEPQTGGSIYVHGKKPLSGPDRRPSFDVGYQHKIFENKHGSIDVGGGAQKLPGQRWEPNVGISGTFRYKREAEDEPQTGGSIYVHGEKPLSGPDRRPSFDVGYQHKIFENKHGSIDVGGGAQKLPGQRWEPNVGISGTFRYKREAEDEPQTGGSIYVHGEKPLSGPDRRPSFDVGYQHKIFENKHGSIDVGGGAQKLPGQRWEPNVGISTTFRYKREAEDEPQTGGSIYVHGEKPLSGPERRPSFDVGYQHKIFENKHGSIDVGGGAQKLPGQRWEPNVGISGTFRYKREADAEPQTGGSIYVHGEKPLSGPDRRPSFDVGYQHKIFENKHGSIDVGGGAQKLPGQRWEPNVGISGTFRYKREADAEPQTGGSIYVHGEKPLSGPDRRPSFDVGYQHKIFENKHGSIDVGGGAQKLPGQRWEPNVGISGTFRYKREADAEPQTGGSIYVRGQKPLSGPERRPSFDVGYQHRVWENKRGSIDVNGGAQKLPGQRWQPNVGISGTYRFRRSAADEEQEIETQEVETQEAED